MINCIKRSEIYITNNNALQGVKNHNNRDSYKIVIIDSIIHITIQKAFKVEVKCCSLQDLRYLFEKYLTATL